METKEYVVYSFDELDDNAKEKVREKFCFLIDAWGADYRNTLDKFCDILGIKIKDWEVSAFGNIYYTLDRRQIHEAFRGKKKKELLKLPEYITGFCADYVIMEVFKFAIKTGETPYDAVDKAIYAFFKEWRDVMEHAISNENIAEYCADNGIKFLKNGDVAP